MQKQLSPIFTLSTKISVEKWDYFHLNGDVILCRQNDFKKGESENALSAKLAGSAGSYGYKQ